MKHNINSCNTMEMACFNAVFDILKFQDASKIRFQVQFLGLIRLSRTVCCETFVEDDVGRPNFLQ